MPDTRDVARIQAGCTRFVFYHPPKRPRDILAELSAFTDPEVDSDIYGKGDLIEGFEAEIATLLGKPAAVFMPSGTMAQQIALRIWADRKGVRNIAFHPTCHLELHEQQAYRELHHLQGILVGDRYSLITLDDLKHIQVPLAALLLELPQRYLGGALPTWEDLNAQTAWTRERDIIAHMDGARLWECQPFYGRDYTEIAALFDTVYVSFYKILNGIAGAALAGPEDLIAEARIWQRRHGGNLVHLYPFVLSARKGLAEFLPCMGDYHAKAMEVAAALARIPEMEVAPNPPHTNMMEVFVRGDRDRLWNAALDIAEERKIWFLRGLVPAEIPAYSVFEIVVGSATLDFSADEIAALFAEMIERVRLASAGS
jgi:threonine aldolase